MLEICRFVWSIVFRSKEPQTYVFSEAPKLQFNEAFSPTMSLSSFNNLFIDPTSANKQDNASPSAPASANKPDNAFPVNSASSTALKFGDNSTPTKQQPVHPDAVATPSRLIGDLSPAQSQLDTPPSGATDPGWTSSNRPTLGKSSRVIESLMANVDRLTREKNLAVARLEEEGKRTESTRSALESLRISNETLSSMHEVDKTMFAKRERKLEELKVDLEAERSRKEKAEQEIKETRRERDQTVEKLMMELAEEREQSKRATSQYEVLSKSWKGLDENYGRQTSRLKADFKQLQKDMVEDKGKLVQLEIIVEQLRQEAEKSEKAKERLFQDFDEYKTEKEGSIRELKERAEQNGIAHDQAMEQLNSVLGEMKYVINVKKDVRDTE